MKILKLERPLVALDVETTGLRSEHDKVVQIGIVIVEPGGNTKEWSTLVNPNMPIPADITDIHGITDEMVANEPPFRVIAPGLKKILQNSDICGYNVDFDLKFLTAEFQRIQETLIPGKVIDSYKIFKLKEPRKLTNAVKFFLNETLPDAHQALADAWASLRVLEAQLERYSDLPRTVEELSKVTNKRYNSEYNSKFVWRGDKYVVNFGKHKDKPIQDVPQDYFDWMLSGGFSKEVKQIVSDALHGKYPTKK